jgi:hypothetical protein
VPVTPKPVINSSIASMTEPGSSSIT